MSIHYCFELLLLAVRICWPFASLGKSEICDQHNTNSLYNIYSLMFINSLRSYKIKLYIFSQSTTI